VICIYRSRFNASSVGSTHTVELGDDLVGAGASSTFAGNVVSGTRGALNLNLTGVSDITVAKPVMIYFNDVTVANGATATSSGLANTMNFYGNLSVLGSVL